MKKYYENGVELDCCEINMLVKSYGNVVLDDLESKEFSDCCEADLDTRSHYKRLIPICSKCGKDIKNER